MSDTFAVDDVTRTGVPDLDHIGGAFAGHCGARAVIDRDREIGLENGSTKIEAVSGSGAMATSSSKRCTTP